MGVDSESGSLDRAGFGSIFVMRPGPIVNVSADFRDFPATAESNVCTVATVGPCEVVHCDLSKDRPAQEQKSAGRVTVKSSSGGSAVLEPTSSKSYDFSSQPLTFFAAGDGITVHADGADVPSFDVPAVTAPASLSALSFNCPSSECGTIARDADLEITWSAAGAGRVEVMISTVQEKVANDMVTCHVPIADGRIVVSKEALGKLPASTTAFTTVNAMNDAVQKLSDVWTVRLLVQNTAASGHSTLK